MKLAVIPARGGSKRIPQKNIREFAGQPIIAYSIRTALDCGIFDRVIVSTDDEEIAAVAKSYGAEVPFVRPATLADDFSPTTAVIAHAIQALCNDSVDSLSAVCCIYATAPFLRREDILKGMEILLAGDWKFIFSATRYASPVHRAFFADLETGVSMMFPQYFMHRSQDLPDVLHDAAQFYWGKPQAWLEQARIFDQHSTVVQIPHWRAQDIDTDEDWVRAELLYRVLMQQLSGAL